MIRTRWTAIAALALGLAGCNDNGQGPDTIPVATVTIDALATALLPGGTAQLTARAVGPNGEALTGRAFTFAGGNASVASVSATGLVTAIGPGTVMVQATAEGQTGSREIPVNYPVPTVTSITPTAVLTDAPAVITVRGTGFYPGTAARLNGVARLTTVVSTDELRFNLTAGDVASVGTLAVSVFNPTPGGGPSANFMLPVQLANICEVVEPLTLGTPVDGALETTDCGNPNADAPVYNDNYVFTTAVPMAVTFTVTSPAFDPALGLFSFPKALAFHAAAVAIRPDPAVLRMLLPARAFTLSVRMATRTGAIGAYRIASSTSTAATITNCESWFVVPPLDLTETVTATDCAPVEDHVQGSRARAARVQEWYWDAYLIILRAGQTVTITLESSAFDAALWVFDEHSTELQSDDNGGGGTNARIVFTAPVQPVQGYYLIEAGPSTGIGATGAYTLRIN